MKDYFLDGDGNYTESPVAGHSVQFSQEGARHEKTFSLDRDNEGREWIAQPASTNFLVTGVFGKVELVRGESPFSQLADLTHRADRNWLADVDDVTCETHGSSAILTATMEDYPTPLPAPPSHRPAKAITVFDAMGEPIHTIDFTDGKSFHHLAYDGTHLVATRSYHPPHPFAYVLKATGDPVGLITIDAFVGRDDPDSRPFLVNDGKEILIVDLETALVLRYDLPR